MNEATVVIWTDSSLQNGQVDASDFPKPEEITSIGFVVKHDKTHIVLARDDMNSDDYRGLLAIPRCCVLSMREVGIGATSVLADWWPAVEGVVSGLTEDAA